VKRKIAVFTATRAEYGLLYWLMKEIQASDSLELQVLVSGMHLSPEFGETWKQIQEDGFHFDARVEMLLSSDTAVGVVKSMGLGVIGLADSFERLRPDLLVVLGDRFEALAAVEAAMIMRIPVAHLHGGELTQGAYDDAIRHAITKMATLHFTAAELYRRRVIQMGEPSELVFNVGALGLERLVRDEPMPAHELAASIGFELGPHYFLATYHPATASDEDSPKSVGAMLEALDGFPEYRVLLTYPNADTGGKEIIPLIEEYASKNRGRVVAVPSLGSRRYLSALSRAAAIVGNSSSGIIEAPSLGIPTVNIGNRQFGRLAASSVIHCRPDAHAISEAIAKAISPSFSSGCRGVVNPYGQGDTSRKIVRILEVSSLPMQKCFHDLEFRQ
jgi:UDP-hydrolysing UDP-N-acetyl-D-glucosamine 2-epimerase